MASRWFLPPLLCCLIAIALGASTGCKHNKVVVKTDFDSKADFAAYKTYAVLPTKSPTLDLRMLNGKPLTTVIQESIEQQLDAKGLRQVEPAKADLVVRWKGVIALELEERDEGTPGLNVDLDTPDSGAFLQIDQTPADAADVPVEVARGGVLVDLLDAKARRTVWRGGVTEVMLDKASDAKRTERLNEAMTKLFANYPPK